jgi:hypothetical protein
VGVEGGEQIENAGAMDGVFIAGCRHTLLHGSRRRFRASSP